MKPEARSPKSKGNPKAANHLQNYGSTAKNAEITKNGLIFRGSLCCNGPKCSRAANNFFSAFFAALLLVAAAASFVQAGAASSEASQEQLLATLAPNAHALRWSNGRAARQWRALDTLTSNAPELKAAMAALAMEWQALDTLTSNAPLAEKWVAARQLAREGTGEAVPKLAALLPDDRLTDLARYALETIPDASVDEALREALGKLDGRPLAGVITSIGARRDAAGRRALGQPPVSSQSERSLGGRCRPRQHRDPACRQGPRGRPAQHPAESQARRLLLDHPMRRCAASPRQPRRGHRDLQLDQGLQGPAASRRRRHSRPHPGG